MEREKILIIDDEKPTLKMFPLFLEVYGFAILTAESGEEGLEVFERERPEIVLTDIKMPGMDGIEVLREIKRRSPTTEVIVITGHGDMDLAIQALNLDAADFINKPIQRQSLEQALSRARERLSLAKRRQHEVESRQEGDILVIHIQGSLNAYSEGLLREAYQQGVDARVRRVVLEFEPSTSVNGAGIAILTQLVLDSEKDGVEIVMAGLSDNFRRVFDIVGLTRMVRLYPTVTEACKGGGAA
ncbi:MAG: anti-sigma-factor antagonist [Desulfomicrobiaceae bacterium]|jgi:anti-anti-sigma factor|nr:anti-sigma-factor antagonist [Desulfomicrobiaceae bacterium]MBZ4684599.1 anti-sigma-factor antagonist [Desulfomicrobiaceae bacterium]